MTMEIVKEIVEKEVSKTKKMNAMSSGEVCWCKKDQCYILKHNSFFLILDNHKSANGYSSGNDMLVRELYPDESITIKFS